MAAQVFVGALTAYAAAGALFAAAFVSLGIGKIDPAAKNAPLGFRVIVAPGAAAFWPLLALRWVKSRRGRRQRV